MLQYLATAANKAEDPQLAKFMARGVAMHNSGLSPQDRGLVERAFLSGRYRRTYIISCTTRYLSPRSHTRSLPGRGDVEFSESRVEQTAVALGSFCLIRWRLLTEPLRIPIQTSFRHQRFPPALGEMDRTPSSLIFEYMDSTAPSATCPRVPLHPHHKSSEGITALSAANVSVAVLRCS